MRVWSVSNTRTTALAQTQMTKLQDAVYGMAYSHQRAHGGGVLACAVGGRVVLGRKPAVGQLFRLRSDGERASARVKRPSPVVQWGEWSGWVR